MSSNNDDENPNAPSRGVRCAYRHTFSCVLQPAEGFKSNVTMTIQSHRTDNRYVVIIVGTQKIVVMRNELNQRVSELDLCAD